MEESKFYGHYASHSCGYSVHLVYQTFATILWFSKFSMSQPKFTETFIEKYFLKVVMAENCKPNRQKKLPWLRHWIIYLEFLPFPKGQDIVHQHLRHLMTIERDCLITKIFHSMQIIFIGGVDKATFNFCNHTLPGSEHQSNIKTNPKVQMFQPHRTLFKKIDHFIHLSLQSPMFCLMFSLLIIPH